MSGEDLSARFRAMFMKWQDDVDFVAWFDSAQFEGTADGVVDLMWEAWKAGRAALSAERGARLMEYAAGETIGEDG